MVVKNSRSIDRKFAGARLMAKFGETPPPVFLRERFELLREIGAGGYGRVYEAHDRDLNRRVAVKVLELGDSDVALREGKALAEFHHDHVVAIYDHGVEPDFRYFVLQYVEGPPLHLWCRDNDVAKLILAMYIEAGAGLVAMHAKGLVHGDFKPANVRVGPDGKPVVLDFGLARHRDTLDREAEERPVFRGTLDYAPPERLLGQPGDDRSDQFSFCVALWEALSGVNPFGACKQSTTLDKRLLAMAFGVIGPLRGSRRVERALRRGLSMRPEDRFPNMQALIDALTPRRWPWREMVVMGAAVVLVCVVLVVPVTTLLTSSRGTSSEFVASARASCMGRMAVVAAHDEEDSQALQLLEKAEDCQRSEASSRMLAHASHEVALEFERRYVESARPPLILAAGLAWHLALVFAEDGHDNKMRLLAWNGLSAANVEAVKVAPVKAAPPPRR